MRNVLCVLLLHSCMCLKSGKVHCLQLAQHHIRWQLSLCCDHSYGCHGFVLNPYRKFCKLTSWKKIGLIPPSPSCWMSRCAVCSWNVRFPCGVSFSSSPDMSSVRPCVMQDQNKVDNLNALLPCSRFCSNLSSLCVCLAFFLSHSDAVLHWCFTHAWVFFCCDTFRWLLLPDSHIRAHCIAKTGLDSMLYGLVLCLELNSRLMRMYTCIIPHWFSGCLPNIASLKLSASHGPSCVCFMCVCVCTHTHTHTLAHEDIVSRMMWQDLCWTLWERNNIMDSEVDCVRIVLRDSPWWLIGIHPVVSNQRSHRYSLF